MGKKHADKAVRALKILAAREDSDCCVMRHANNHQRGCFILERSMAFCGDQSEQISLAACRVRPEGCLLPGALR